MTKQELKLRELKNKYDKEVEFANSSVRSSREFFEWNMERLNKLEEMGFEGWLKEEKKTLDELVKKEGIK